MQPDEEAVYNFCTELLDTKQVSDATFQAAVKAFGEKGVVDLIGAHRLLPDGVGAAERRSLSAAGGREAGAEAVEVGTQRSEDRGERDHHDLFRWFPSVLGRHALLASR